MIEFENVLQECLLALEDGDVSVQECLARYPNYAFALEPVLLTSLDLERGREAQPSAAFKARVRAKLTQEMRAHPRRAVRSNFLWTRLTTSFAALVLIALVAGTGYAQSAMPGEPFYSWKRMSENVWRAVSPDPIGVDLLLAERRADELIAVGNHSEQYTQTLNDYLAVVSRLELEAGSSEERVRSVLDSQVEELNNAGISLPELDQDVLPDLELPTIIPVPTQTLLPLPEAPVVNATLPLSVVTSTPVPVQEQETSPKQPTDAPKIVVTLPVDTNILPTIQIPSLLP